MTKFRICVLGFFLFNDYIIIKGMMTFDNCQKITVDYIFSLSRLKTISGQSVISLLNKFGNNVCRFQRWKLECSKDSPASILQLEFLSTHFLTFSTHVQGNIIGNPRPTPFTPTVANGGLSVCLTIEGKCRGVIVTHKIYLYIRIQSIYQDIRIKNKASIVQCSQPYWPGIFGGGGPTLFLEITATYSKLLTIKFLW